jgi:mono/diheme cytochrome c family protein
MLAAATALIFLAGCHRLPPSKPLNELTPKEMSGYRVYQAHCAVCHNETSPNGPNLRGLFRQQYLPSGAPANDDRVLSVILYGRAMMPPFGNVLDRQQEQDLLAYLHTL